MRFRRPRRLRASSVLVGAVSHAENRVDRPSRGKPLRRSARCSFAGSITVLPGSDWVSVNPGWGRQIPSFDQNPLDHAPESPCQTTPPFPQIPSPRSASDRVVTLEPTRAGDACQPVSWVGWDGGSKRGVTAALSRAGRPLGGGWPRVESPTSGGPRGQNGPGGQFCRTMMRFPAGSASTSMRSVQLSPRSH